MRIMLVGDVVGRPGRRAFQDHTPKLRAEKGIDVVIVNGENSAGGKGFTRKALDELYRGGADIVTSGNHVWDKKDVLSFIDDEPFLIRPANYPEGTPGKGWCSYPFKAKNIGVMNLSGRAFMPPLDCPFQKVEELLREMKRECDLIFLDFHAETTSEKMAMGFYLDGRVNGVVGTHTHVQTADERLLPKGTAYITDLGMVGPRDSVLGVKTDIILRKFTTAMPVRFDLAEGPCTYCAVIVEVDDATNKTRSIERIRIEE
ncbi:TIGR00282 family metallophosphoesterase [Mitsuokella sp.]|uniref:TIGR00282 family metallophosphoesterase n=1 Tax=Mitsuokella TaxID=52225 RepID=UPI0029E26C94|nr:TIGR00282 family metallophosphoesterase [Mitsuokella sp.]MDD6382106.1 TIGR00282 family metallophosphoesterase [Selenomonadaceae bacterium]MDY4474769.1 TIGR00282 family metallophosphoesterase [Mitsuokella sp.]